MNKFYFLYSLTQDRAAGYIIYDHIAKGDGDILMKHLFDDKKYLCWGLVAFFVIIASILFYMLLQHLSGIRSVISQILGVLSPIVWGCVIAYLLQPVLKFFQRTFFDPLFKKLCRRKPDNAPKAARGAACALSLILLVIVLVSLLWMLLPQVYESIETLVINLPSYATTAVSWVQDKLSNYPELEDMTVSLLDSTSGALTNWFQNSILPQLESILTNVTTGVYRVVRAVFDLFIGFIVSLYLMYNTEKFSGACKKLLYGIFPLDRAKRILNAVRFVDDTFMRFISGTLIDSLMIGVLCYIVCSILGMPYAVLISVIVGVFNIIPFFGPFIGAIPSAFLILMVSPVKCLIFVIFIFILQQFDGNVLVPKILGRTVGIKGFWVIFSILIGGGLFGFAGMVLGVPVMTVVLAAGHYLVSSALERRGLSTESEVYETLDYIDPETGRAVSMAEGKNTVPDGEDTDGDGDDENSRNSKSRKKTPFSKK